MSAHRFVCGCVAKRRIEDWEIVRVGSTGAKCHSLGEIVTEREIRYASYVDAEWDRAERDLYEQT